MSKRIVVMTLALLVSLASIASAQTPATKDAAESKATESAPRLTIVEPVKDMGVVAKGEKLTWAFLVKNTGNADLEIRAARPGCGCTVTDFDKVIKPGETGKVTATVDTTAFSGPIAKPVTLETNDLSAPTAQLTLHATVKPYVEAFPAGYVRYNMLQGDAQTQSVTLYSEESEPFEITKIENPADWVRTSVSKITDPAQRAQNVGLPAQNQYKLDITVGGPDATPGPLAHKIHVITNSKHQPDYYITVTGVIRPTVRVDPPNGIVSFGEVTANDPAAMRSVVLRSGNIQNPGVFNVTKAETNIPGVTATVKPTQNPGEYEVQVQVGPGVPPGSLDGTMKIYTNDKVNPVVAMQIKGSVKAAAATSASKSK